MQSPSGGVAGTAAATVATVAGDAPPSPRTPNSPVKSATAAGGGENEDNSSRNNAAALADTSSSPASIKITATPILACNMHTKHRKALLDVATPLSITSENSGAHDDSKHYHQCELAICRARELVVAAAAQNKTSALIQEASTKLSSKVNYNVGEDAGADCDLFCLIYFNGLEVGRTSIVSNTRLVFVAFSVFQFSVFTIIQLSARFVLRLIFFYCYYYYYSLLLYFILPALRNGTSKMKFLSSTCLRTRKR